MNYYYKWWKAGLLIKKSLKEIIPSKLEKKGRQNTKWPLQPTLYCISLSGQIVI